MPLTGNKGEWSEIYTLLKILSDKNIYSGDSELNKVETLLFPIIKIIRDYFLLRLGIKKGGSFESLFEKGQIVLSFRSGILHFCFPPLESTIK